MRCCRVPRDVDGDETEVANWVDCAQRRVSHNPVCLGRVDKLFGWLRICFSFFSSTNSQGSRGQTAGPPNGCPEPKRVPSNAVVPQRFVPAGRSKRLNVLFLPAGTKRQRQHSRCTRQRPNKIANFNKVTFSFRHHDHDDDCWTTASPIGSRIRQRLERRSPRRQHRNEKRSD